MGYRQPDPSEQEPEDIGERRADYTRLAKSLGIDKFLAERKSCEAGNAECGGGKWQSDDRDGHEATEYEPGERIKQAAAENEPNKVTQCLHFVAPIISGCLKIRGQLP